MESSMRSGAGRNRAAPVWYDESAVDGVKVRASYLNADDAEVTEEEALAYVKRGRKNYPCGRVEQIHLMVDGDEVEIGYRLDPLGLDRIRRMIGGEKAPAYIEGAGCPKAKRRSEHV